VSEACQVKRETSGRGSDVTWGFGRTELRFPSLDVGVYADIRVDVVGHGRGLGQGHR
jgi:hypothetical protein